MALRLENVDQWFDVPAGSTVSVSVTPNDDSTISFVSHGRVVATQGDEEHWADHDLNPGPAETDTDDETTYNIRLAVRFFGQTEETATVIAEVIDPDGNALDDWFGETLYEHEVTGKAGDPARRVLLMIVQD